jgi:hypothetical protein
MGNINKNVNKRILDIKKKITDLENSYRLEPENVRDLRHIVM